MQSPETSQPQNLNAAQPAQLARIVDSSSGVFMPGTALLAASGEMLFGPSGPGLSYVPYLAAEGETLISVRRYADALHFERLKTADDVKRAEGRKLARQEAAERRVAFHGDDASEGTGARGVVRGFSDDARRRMARTCAKVPGLEKASFVTLTLSDEIVAKYWHKWDAKPDVERMAEDLRSSIAALDKRGQRFWTRSGLTFGFIWKIENQRRKSGRFEGYLVPHAHLIVTGLADVAVTRQRRWLKAAWWHICGEASDGHERAGVQVDKVYSRAGAGVYVAKYVAKRPDDAEDAELEIGRRWGLRGTVDTTGEDVAVITLAQYVQIRRYVARWLQGRWKGGRRYARRIRRPSSVVDALFIFGAGFESSVGSGLSESLIGSVL